MKQHSIYYFDRREVVFFSSDGLEMLFTRRRVASFLVLLILYKPRLRRKAAPATKATTGCISHTKNNKKKPPWPSKALRGFRAQGRHLTAEALKSLEFGFRQVEALARRPSPVEALARRPRTRCLRTARRTLHFYGGLGSTVVDGASRRTGLVSGAKRGMKRHVVVVAG